MSFCFRSLYVCKELVLEWGEFPRYNQKGCLLSPERACPTPSVGLALPLLSEDSSGRPVAFCTL